MTGVDASLIEQFPYLEISEADLQVMLESDTPFQQGLAAIEEFKTKIADYERRSAAFQARIEQLANQRAELEAQLKANDTETRETRGAKAGMTYHIALAKRRITERESALSKRQKFLFRNEVNRRLSKMGKEFKLNLGTRAARGMGRGVVEKS